jgi:hypothetical protein
VSWTPIAVGAGGFDDPLGYGSDPRLVLPADVSREDWLSRPHSDRDWLRATMYTGYPVAVPAIAEFFAYDGELAAHRDRIAPDFVLTPAEGWDLGSHLGNTTNHGGLRRPSMHVPMLVAGPDVPAGYRFDEPRLVMDIAPTALAAADMDFDPADFDGRSLWDVAGPAGGAAWWRGRVEAMPEAVARVPVRPVTDLKAYEATPKTWWERPVLHDRKNPLDIHNVGTDLLTLSELEVVTLVDGLFDLVVPGAPVKPLDSTLAGAGGLLWRGRTSGSYLGTRLEQLAWALKVRQIALGDVSPFSSGNRERISGVIDWLQLLLDDADRAVASPFKREHVLGTPVVNGAVDLVQGGVERAIDTVFYHIGRGLSLAGYGLEHLGGMVISPWMEKPEAQPAGEPDPELLELHSPPRDILAY